MTTSPLAILGGSPAVTMDGPHFTWPPIRESMGLKFRIHPLAAAIVLEQLHHLDECLDGRAQIASRMMKQLAGVPGSDEPAAGFRAPG